MVVLWETVIQAGAPVMLQVQFPEVVTVTLPDPPEAETVALVLLSEKLQGAGCWLTV